MLRIIVSIVFALTVLAASAAHAALMPSSFSSVVSGMGLDTAEQCRAEINPVLETAAPSCVLNAHNNVGGQRCQIDVAPLQECADIFSALNPPMPFVVNIRTPADWMRKPMLQPPQFC